MIPRFPFSIIKPRSSIQSVHSDSRQPKQASAKLPLGAVAMAVVASHPVPATTSPSSDAQDAHTQAALHPAPESIAAQKAAARQTSVKHRPILDQVDSGKQALPATTSRQLTPAHKVQLPVSLCQDDSGSQAAQLRAADAAGENQDQLQPAVANCPSQVSDALKTQQGPDVPASGLSRKRLHDAVGQDLYDLVQPKHHVAPHAVSDEPSAQKPKLMQPDL